MARRDKERVKKDVNPQESKTPMSKKWEEHPPIITKDYNAKKKNKDKVSSITYKF